MNLTSLQTQIASLLAQVRLLQSKVSQDTLSKSGGTMTGNLYLSEDPVSATEAATKNYVDTQIQDLKKLLNIK